jgi:hypothetical protein
MSTSQKIVLEIWNGPSILKGAHAVAVEKSIDKYFVYNTGEKEYLPSYYDTLKEYINNDGGSLIIGYLIG